MLGGLAAGLGLAWLANSLGLGAAFGNILLIALLVLAARGGVAHLRGRSRGNNGAARSGGFAFQGAGGPANATRAARSTARTTSATTPRRVRGSATPPPSTPARAAEHRPTRSGGSSMAGAAAAGGSMIGSALAGSQSWGMPAGFDADGFLDAAKRNFVTLQDAWDRADIAHPAFDDDRRHGGRDPPASWPSARPTPAASRTRPRW